MFGPLDFFTIAVLTPETGDPATPASAGFPPQAWIDPPAFGVAFDGGPERPADLAPAAFDGLF